MADVVADQQDRTVPGDPQAEGERWDAQELLPFPLAAPLRLITPQGQSSGPQRWYMVG